MTPHKDFDVTTFLKKLRKEISDYKQIQKSYHEHQNYRSAFEYSLYAHIYAKVADQLEAYAKTGEIP